MLKRTRDTVLRHFIVQTLNGPESISFSRELSPVAESRAARIRAKMKQEARG
jgi:hypothetical protein